jgi:hypothetical protein
MSLHQRALVPREVAATGRRSVFCIAALALALSANTRADFSEGFEAWPETSAWQTISSNGWTLTAAQIRGVRGGFGTPIGTRCAWLNDADSATNASLHSPTTPNGIDRLDFSSRRNTGATGSSIAAIESSPDGSNWNEIAIIDSGSDAWEAFSVTIQDVNARHARIRKLSDGGVNQFMGLDDITLVEAPAVLMSDLATDPEFPLVSDAVHLEVRLHPGPSVSSVTLQAHYRLGTAGTFTTIAMSPAQGNLYRTQSPIAAGFSGTVQYFIEAIHNGYGVSPLWLPAAGAAAPASYSTQIAALDVGDRQLGPCSKATALTITEFMPHPPALLDGRSLEFIELFNSDQVPVPLAGLRLAGDIAFTFPSNAVLPARQFALVAADPALIQTVYGLSDVYGPFTNTLPNSAGSLRLRNAQDAILLDVAYDLNGSALVAADGGGHSVVLRRPDLGEANTEAWGPSSRHSGSPGGIDPLLTAPLSRIVINEALAHTDLPELDFIELYNTGSASADLSGCTLSDSLSSNKFAFPPGTTLAPGAFLSRTQTELGFSLSSHGDEIVLRDGANQRILDAVRFPAQANGVPLGRHPDGAPEFAALLRGTPGATNAAPVAPTIVINEIMFQPLSGDDADEYIELLNNGATSVDLSYWRFLDGIEFAFPPGTTIAPGAFLVVAADPARLIAAHTNLNAANTFGTFSGKLSNRGERLLLAKPDDPALPFEDFVTVDEITYSDGWATWTDGGGSSLELVDAHSDNRRASNWAGSDESRKAPWTRIEATGTLDHGLASFPPTELHVLMLDAGICLLDNINITVDGGANLLVNGSFESGAAEWLIQGNHYASICDTSEGYQSTASLKLVAEGDGDNASNRAECDVTGLSSGQTNVTIRAYARWQAGHRQVLLRLLGNWHECVGTLDVPANLGTPGAPNSRAIPNAGPALWELTHAPILPVATSNVTVTVRAADPDGLASILLRYRLDPSGPTNTLSMRDDGNDPDTLAGDGRFSATIPGQSADTIVAFHIIATDTAGATNRAPATEALVCFGQSPTPGAFGTYRFWITQATRTLWSAQPKLSNRLMPCTFIYNQWRAEYDARIRYRSSAFIRPTGDPNSVNCSYAFRVPKTARFLGNTSFNLDGLEFGRDDTYQRERTCYWFAEQLGIPHSLERYVQIYVNTIRKGKVYADAHHPNRAFIDSWFPNDADGDLAEIDDWFEFNDSFGIANVDATLQNFTTTDGSKKRARYRWNWERKTNRPVDDDASELFAIVDAMNLPAGTTYDKRVNALVNVDEWMRVFAVRHLVSDWDGYGYNRGKNTYYYCPQEGPAHMLLWDLDFSLGAQSHGTTADLFSINDPVLATKFFIYPGTRRAYWRALQDAVNGPFQSAVAGPVMDAQYAAFTNSQVTVASPDTVKTWIDQRRAYVQSQLALVASPAFAITTADGTTNISPARIAGTAPLSVATLMVNSNTAEVTWNTESTWSLPASLVPGAQVVTVTAHDRTGLEIGRDTVTLTYTGPAPASPAGDVIINEVMYDAPFAGGNFVELYNRSTNQTYDLAGYRLNGAEFTFPSAALIRPGQFLVVAENLTSYGWHYTNTEVVVGTYGGSLDNGGETLNLQAPDGTNWLTIDTVRYDDDPPWPASAAGGGRSLQLLDPNSDNSLPGNWIDAMIPPAPNWRYHSVTGGLISGHPSVLNNASLRLFRTSAGEAWVDDVALVNGLIADTGTNLLSNPGFESPFSGWRTLGNHAGSARASAAAHSGSNAYRLTATGPGAFGTDAVVTNFPLSGSSGRPFTFSFWYLEAPAGGTLTAFLTNTTLFTSVNLDPPPPRYVEPYTPGRTNAVLLALAPLPPLTINEVMPVNTSTFPDNAADFDPWIELYNASPAPLSLAGFHLSDRYDDLIRWAFPSNASIGAGGRLLIWADAETNETDAANLHASFRLHSVTGSVILTRLTLDRIQVVDSLDYANVGAAYSFGSYPEGDTTARGIFHTPTPADVNSPTSMPVSIRINEWMARNTATIRDPTDGKYEDWFELYNAAGAPVHLAGYRLTDTLADLAKFTIPLGIVIPANGFLLVWADSDDDVNGSGVDLHVNFALSQDGEALALVAPDGTIVDALTFGMQTADHTEGRWPDGDDAIQVLTPPTPGAANRVLLVSDLPPAAAGDGFTVEWAATSGTVYRYEATENLLSTNWQTLAIITATSDTVTFSDPTIPPPPLRFYRITL